MSTPGGKVFRFEGSGHLLVVTVQSFADCRMPGDVEPSWGEEVPQRADYLEAGRRLLDASEGVGPRPVPAPRAATLEEIREMREQLTNTQD